MRDDGAARARAGRGATAQARGSIAREPTRRIRWLKPFTWCRSTRSTRPRWCATARGLEPEALEELRASIAAGGLRMPVEVFALAEPREGRTHGLISGFRRLAAVRALHGETGEARHARIAAFVRAPEDIAAALAAMVEENEIREELSPWERGRMLVMARDMGVFDSIEAAVDGAASGGEQAEADAAAGAGAGGGGAGGPVHRARAAQPGGDAAAGGGLPRRLRAG